MYRVVQAQDGTWFNYFVSSSGPEGGAFFGILLGPFSSAGPPNLSEVIYEADGLLSEGPKWTNIGDETNVEHYQITGDLTLLPFSYSLYKTTRSWPVWQAKTKKGATRYFSHVLSYGQTIETSARNEDNVNSYLAEWDGVHFRFGYFVDPDAGSGHGKMVKWTWNSSFSLWSSSSTDHTSISAWRKDRSWPQSTTVKPAYDTFVYKGVDPRVVGDVVRCMGSSWGVYSLKFLPPDDYAFGDLAQTCMDALRYTDVNSISFLKELPEVASLIPKFSGWTNPRTYANAYLCFKYGLRLTMQDIKALTEGLKAFWALKWTPRRATYAFRKHVLLSDGVPVVDEYHYKLVTEPYPSELMDVIRKLDGWGLAPTSARIWDSIPFSFVLDWVLDVGSLLERADMAVMVQYYNVIAVVRSRKVSKTLSSTRISKDIPWVGTLSLSWYVREVSKKIDLPIPRFDESSPEFRNYAELASLIAVMSKH